MSSDLYDYPELYDALLPAHGHVAHYRELARQAKGGVLELACGSGLLSVPIAKAGCPMVGLDLSQTMLGAARERADRAGVAMEFVAGDMRDFDLGRTFSLIFIARNSMLHLHATEDLLAMLAAVKRHLAPGGIFAFDIFNPSVRLLARPAGQRFPAFEARSESLGILTVEESCAYDAATQVNHARWFISTADKHDAWTLALDLRSIFPQELPLLLAAGGFDLTRRTGDLDGQPFTSSSRLQVCLCQFCSGRAM